MKRTITLRYLFTLCVMTLVSAFCGGNLALAEDVTEDFPTLNDICTQFGFTSNQKLLSSGDNYADKTYTSKSGNINLTFTWGNVSSIPETYASQNLRVYSGNTMTVSMADSKNKITSIELSFQSSTTSRYIDECNTGSLTKNGAVSTWTPEEGNSTSSVTFSASSSRSHGRIIGIKVTYEPATKQDVTLSMPESAIIDVLETFDAAENLTLTVSGGGDADKSAITYSVEPAGDFTFDSKTGLFTAGKTEGSYTITATFPEDENYSGATASTLVTVSSRVWATKYYVKVTDESQLVDGARYILVYDDGQNFNYMGDFNASQYIAANIGGNRYGDGIIPSGIEDTYKNPSVMPFTLVSVGNNFALHTKYGYLQCFNSGTTIMVGLNVADTYKDNNLAQWTIKIDAGNAHIVNVEDNTLSLAYDQYNSGYQAMRNPSSVQLYAKCAEMPFNAQALGYGTFAVPYAYKMPAGVKGYAITGLKETDKLQKVEAYSAGQLVPALTPLLVYNENVADADVNAYPIIVNKEVAASYKDVNYLEFKRNAENMTASKREEAGAVKYYKLTKNEDKPLGFYWGAEDGAAFSMQKTSSAYLALPQNLNAAAGLLFDEAGEATGIQLTPAGETAAPAVYNLQGVRVSGKLAKGLYIVNGKKVLVK